MEESTPVAKNCTVLGYMVIPIRVYPLCDYYKYLCVYEYSMLLSCF